MAACDLLGIHIIRVDLWREYIGLHAVLYVPVTVLSLVPVQQRQQVEMKLDDLHSRPETETLSIQP